MYKRPHRDEFIEGLGLEFEVSDFFTDFASVAKPAVHMRMSALRLTSPEWEQFVPTSTARAEAEKGDRALSGRTLWYPLGRSAMLWDTLRRFGAPWFTRSESNDLQALAHVNVQIEVSLPFGETSRTRREKNSRLPTITVRFWFPWFLGEPQAQEGL